MPCCQELLTRHNVTIKCGITMNTTRKLDTSDHSKGSKDSAGLSKCSLNCTLHSIQHHDHDLGHIIAA